MKNQILVNSFGLLEILLRDMALTHVETYFPISISVVLHPANVS